MTKKSIVILALSGLATTAQAEFPIWFSIDGGYARPLTKDNYQNQIDDAGLDASLSGTADWRGSLRVGVGVDLDQWLPVAHPWSIATQVEYLTLGEVDVDYSGNFLDAASFYDELEEIHPESIKDGIALSVLGRWRGFNGALEPVSLGARAGVTGWRQHYTLRDDNGNKVGSDKRFGVAPTAGLETTYEINSHLTARLGWNVYWMDRESAQLVSAGLEFRPMGLTKPGQWDLTPAQMADEFTVAQGTNDVSLDVLANDADQGQALKITNVTPAANGHSTISPDRKSIIYRQRGGTFSEDSFSYWFSSGRHEYGPVSVTVHVDLPEPVGEDDHYQVEQNEQRVLKVLVNDHDPNKLPLTITRLQLASNSVSTATTDGKTILYQQAGKKDKDLLVYWLSNGSHEVGPVRVEMDVRIPIPKGISDAFSVPQGNSMVLDVLANDVNYGEAPLVISRITAADRGQLELKDGILTYQHDGSVNARDRFQYWMTDGREEVGPIDVQITVTDRSMSNAQTLFIYFASNKSEVAGDYLPELTLFADQFKADPDLKFVIYGYTDNVGSDAVNNSLSLKRAETIKNYLVNILNMNPNQLSTVGMGKKDPLVSNDTAEGRAKNRRVEIRMAP
ncbi:Ig-like domain-containing protein [Gynuella sp.]|uniref:Ig-like domain-containing protein n=1 Tax=Gynuella sp. TaxID=2969146 RepID=UPI003D1517F6